MGKRKWIFVILLVGFSIQPAGAKAQGTEIIKVIQEGIKKVIRAVDLRIQRLQNETIWLQNAQKAIENTLSKLRLDEISDWVERQRQIYADYFDELHRVRSIITYYRKIKSITDRQVKIVTQYKTAFALFKRDSHFNRREIEFMDRVYNGIFNESLKNLDQLFLVINSFATTMTDAERLEIIDKVSDNMDQNYFDLQAFNNENKLVSLQRAKSAQEVQTVKALYGID